MEAAGSPEFAGSGVFLFSVDAVVSEAAESDCTSFVTVVSVTTVWTDVSVVSEVGAAGDGDAAFSCI